MSETDDGLEPPGGQDIAPIAIEDEMRKSYLDYAMSVIVSRALPDVRDGLKPVHRRILYAMQEGGFTSDKPYRKSANIVGRVMGDYHPHGDSAIYDALVRMAQPFSMSLLLIDGQGNFGSMDGDPPAAMRYTESRLAKVAAELLEDYDKNTVDFQPNYDEQRQEPKVLPAKFPNLLVNGAGGIAVGMATNIPPHNLGEVIDGALAMLADPAISDEALLELVPGPDFPTGGEIVGRSGARRALLTGRGSVTMRSRHTVEEIRKDRQAIIFHDMPYQVNKAKAFEHVSELVREKKIEGIAEMRDESDRFGVRVVFELKRDAAPDIVLNQIRRFSAFQSNFAVNMLALDHGRPELMTLRQILEAFLHFREEVVTRRTKFELAKARDRGHAIVGLAAAVANIDEVIRIIREAPDPASAREALKSRPWPAKDTASLVALIADPRSSMDAEGNIRLSDEQARAILDLRLHRLTALGRDELGAEAKALADKITDYLDILRSRERVVAIIREEMESIKERYAGPRRTVFVEGDLDIEDEDLIAREDMVVTISHGGYVKRTPLSDYRAQHRGGKGRKAMGSKGEDAVTRMFVADTHTPVLFFTSAGMVHKLKVWRLPLGAPQARGRALVNLLELADGARITSVMPMPEDEESWGEWDVVFATKSGHVRRNKLSDFIQVNRGGKIAMKFEEDESDEIVGVQVCTPGDDVLLTTAGGYCIRFSVEDVRVFAGRNSIGVRGIRLSEDDEVVSMAVLRHVEAEPAEARAYLKHAGAMRRAAGDEENGEAAAAAPEIEEVEDDEDGGAMGEDAGLSPERIAELGALEQFVLTVTDDGFGKRASAYEYRVTGRGGKGLIAHDLSRGGKVATSFPVEDADQVMLVTDGGQLIRTPVAQIRIAGRATRGVTILRTGEDERVVAVERLAEEDGDDEETNGSAGENGAAPTGDEA